VNQTEWLYGSDGEAMAAAVVGALTDRKGTQIAVAALRGLPERLIGGYSAILNDIEQLIPHDPGAEPLFPTPADEEAIGCDGTGESDLLGQLVSLHDEFEIDRNGFLNAAELELNQAVNDLAVRAEGVASWFRMSWWMVTTAHAF
jgi:hypothetical protein